jgi:DNA-binding transcriptional LysR family regulator
MGIGHRHIEVFRAVMSAGSVTAAAAMLRTSQPTVSRELAQLEQLLGFDLFDRVRGRLRPTARALALYDQVQRSYAGLERILAAAEALRAGVQGRLSIICMPSLAHSPLPAVCRRFLARHPEVAIAITAQESPLLEEWLTAQRHDLGLTERSLAPPGTRLEPLLAADEVCVLPRGHRLAGKRLLRPADFQGERFVSLAPSDPYRLQMDEIFLRHGVERRLVAETDSAVSVCRMVQEGLGAAIVNPLTAAGFRGRGVVLRPFSVAIPFRVSLVRPEFRPSNPLVEDFVAELRAEVGS